ncbi:MAG TPA: hypothetical protein VGF84_23955, partial [Micromonosporaceae bacterium]
MRGSRMRWRYGQACLVSVVVMTLMLSACTGAKPAPTHSTRTGPIKVSDASTTVMKLPNGASVTIPAGSLSGAGTLTGSVVAPSAPAPAGTEFLGDIYDVTLSDARIVAPITLALPATIPRIDGRPGPPPMLVYLDTATNAWTPFPSTYNPSTHMVVAQTPHLTRWGLLFEATADALLSGAEDLFKKTLGVSDTAAQPACPATAAAKTAGITATSTSGSLMKWCVGSQNGSGYLRVANDRSFAIEFDYPAAWSARKDGWTDL